MSVEQIIENYGKQCEAERQEASDRKAAFEAKNTELTALISRLNSKRQEITFDGICGAYQMLSNFTNPYHFLRLAAEYLKAYRSAKDFLLSPQGAPYAHNKRNPFFYLDRVAAFRRRAVDLFQSGAHL